MAVRAHTVGRRRSLDPYRHRHELYLRAAPLFRTFGYRQVTMKALAHACGVSAPALYRYFPSKLEFAVFPLDAGRAGYCAELLRRAAAAFDDPLRGLRAAIEAGIAEVDLLVLGTRLGIEAGQDKRDVIAAYDFERPMAEIGEIALRCAPALGDRARELAHSLMSLVISAAVQGQEPPPDALWRQSSVLVRGYLGDAGVPTKRLDEVFGRA